MLPLQRYLLLKAEHLFAVFGLLMLAKALPFLYRDLIVSGYSIDEAAGGNARFQIIMAAVYAVSAAVVLLNFRKALYLAARNKALLLFALFVVASAAWADEPALALRRCVALAGTTVFGLYLVVRFDRQELMEILGRTALIILLTSTIAIVAMPEIAIDTRRDGALRGLYTHKNDFGAIMVLCAVILWVRWQQPDSNRLLAMVGWGLSIFYVALSGSRSAWLVAIGLFVVAVPLLRALRTSTFSRSLRLFAVAVFGVGGFVIAVLEFHTAGLEAVGKDITLTNRTIIWQLVMEQGMERPLLGYGFGSFWEGGAGRALALVWQGIGHSHNGYMDVWVELGLVGLGLFAVTLLLAVRRTIWEVISFREPIALFLPIFVFMMMVYNIAARAIPEHSTIEWALFVAGMLYTSLPYPDRFRRTAAAPPSALASAAASARAPH